MVLTRGRMDECRVARRVLIVDASGGRVGGEPRLSWKDGVKLTMGSRGMTVGLRGSE